MRIAKPLVAALLVGPVMLTSSLPAASAPLPHISSLAKDAKNAPASEITNVQYWQRGPGGYRGGYGYRGGGYGYRGGHHHDDGAGLAIGLAAGAILGGAIAASQAQAQQSAAYCAQRYRSYDPRSGTYLNVDGNRYRCP